MGERIINTTRKALAAAGVVAVIAAGTTACDPSDSLSPAAKVKQAFDKLGKQKSLSTEIGFNASADQIFKAMKDEKGFTREDADMLAGMRLAYSFGSDKALKDAESDDKSFKYGVALTLTGDKPMFEARQVDEKAYLRLDFKGLSSFVEKQQAKKGKKADAEDKAFQKLINDADQLPSSLASVKGALKGDWISLDPATFEEFAKSMDKGGDTKSAKPDPKTQKQIYEVLQRALTDNAEVKDAGKKDGIDHVKATVPAKKVAKDISEGLKPLKAKLGDKAGKLDELDRDLEKLDKKDDKNVTFDVSIKDGMLAGLTLDIGQFDTKAKGELPLSIGFKSGSGKVEAPAGAQELKPQDLMGAAMFVMGGGKDESGL
ncbi:hypothetical protein BLA24_14140 [Streptomyces cinnamoneus]|uniref:Uncharacterized protein n=1 Tax=Streptomyces cinnamoneus TaxID=53446 RepID=A0A2G1XI88_STRCJ|nr:hypothetical protein [Streptomyces cinnamoneus]PHQ50935.1 hypothetical protein BLA24_14140 [Streptomyces cinnamoneus]PPT13844.1 hypothetical protein CYQ11_13935 [Streptomyces cinnamoneus]